MTKTPSQLYSVDDRVQVWEDGARVCHYCDKKLPKPTIPASAGGTKASKNTHLDHVIAQAKGGSDDLSNLVVCCKRCNTEKGDRDYLAFLTSRLTQAETQTSRLKALIVAFHAGKI